ncbi:MAG: Nif3-like dinuclear metal center hexameric protein [Clostridia bacterium]|nr:Nif3-like dinuclear metal center hexameric protein [Clostridia bacterium]
MTYVRYIYNYIDRFAPFDTQMDFDNSGLIIGSDDKKVFKAMLCLDITKEVVEEAKLNSAQLIISHHPCIFNPIKRLEPDSVPYMLAAYGITAICAHTNLDMAQGGVNDVLCEKIGLTNVTGLLPVSENVYACRIGELEDPLSPSEFAQSVSKALHYKGVTYTEGDCMIKKVAVCSGAGDDLLSQCFDSADAFVTGEVHHHIFLQAKELGKTLVCAGHYATEAPAMDALLKILDKNFPDVEFVRAKSDTNPQKCVY